MKGFGIGLAVGLVFGTAMAAFAVAGFDSGWQLQQRDANFQYGYVAGASDAAIAIADANVPHAVTVSIATCLQRHSGGNLSGLTTWLRPYFAQHAASQAASIILGACIEETTNPLGPSTGPPGPPTGPPDPSSPSKSSPSTLP